MVASLLTSICKNCSIRQRYIVVIMLHLALVNSYHMRVVLNIAMTEIVHHTEKPIEACSMYNYTRVRNIEGGRYYWSNNVEALILYSFYIGYCLSNIPAGWMADKWGARHVLGLSMAFSAITTLAYPFVIKVSEEVGAVALRVVLGLVQGPVFPSIATLIQCWVPAKERSSLGGVTYGGASLGSITGYLFSDMMIYSFESWEMPFYIWGIVTIIWYMFYMMTVYSTVESNPFITKEELKFLREEICDRRKHKVPWKRMFKSRPLYALLASQLGHDFLNLTLVTVLSKYLNNILKLSVTENANFTALSFSFLWISNLISAFLGDFMINRHVMTTLMQRKVYTVFAHVVPGILLVALGYVGCRRYWAITLSCMALFSHGPLYAGMKVNINDITFYHAGSVMGLVNGLGSIAGILGPLIVGFITPTYALEEWQLFFWIMFAVEVAAALTYWFLASVERQDWDYLDNEIGN